MVSYSPELNPDIGKQQSPGAAAFYNNTLYYISNSQDATIWVYSRTCDEASLNPAEASSSTEQTYWGSSQTKLQDEPNFGNFTGGCGTWAPPACAVAGDYLYFVWVQAGGTNNLRVFATRLVPSPDGKSVTWSAPVSLGDVSGSPLVMAEEPGHGHTPNTTFAVTAWGDYLIACYNGENNYGPATWLMVYDTGDWPSQTAPSSWKASSQWSANLNTWPNFPAYADLGGWISMDWFTPGGSQPGTASAAPAIYLIISFFNQAKNQAYIWHAMDLTPPGQWTDGQPFKQWEVENRASPSLGVNVIRDPAGRMRAYSCDASNQDIQYVTMPTNQVSPDGYSWASFGQDWSLLYGKAAPVAAHQAPIPVFVLGPKTTVPIKVGSKTKQATVRQVYEFILYENEGTKLVFSHYGEAKWIADAHTLNFNEPVNPNHPDQGGALKPGEKPRLVVTGLVDSPLPIPAANLQGQSITGTLGSVDYGWTQSEGDKRTTSWSWSAGFISEGYATAGAGPAWQISFNAGMAGSTGRSATIQNGTELVSTADAQASALIVQGNYFHAGVIFHRDEYLFYQVNLDGTISETPVNNAPTITSIWIEYTGLANDPLQPYANTVGDLSSYTRAGWNARMNQLGYPGDDYFDEVIAAQDADGNYVNAVVLGSDGTPYLEFSWSPSGYVIQSHNDVTSTFEESGWHMDASAYVGYSFDVGAEIFGVGEEEVGELLVGGSYSRSTQVETTEGNSWGIYVTYAPPIPASTYYDGQVTAFSWRLWLLKANPQWTNELLAYGAPTLKDQIDPNSSPWRIVFEVDPDSIVHRSQDQMSSNGPA